MDDHMEALVAAYKEGLQDVERAGGMEYDEVIAAMLERRGVTTVEQARKVGVREGPSTDDAA